MTDRTGDDQRHHRPLRGRRPRGPGTPPAHRRLIDPDEVADAVLLCLASAAITGQGINVDGGAVQS